MLCMNIWWNAIGVPIGYKSSLAQGDPQEIYSTPDFSEI